MRLFPVSLGAMLLLLASSFASADVNERSALQEAIESLQARQTTTYASGYVGYLGPRLSEGPVVQSELVISESSGWHFGVWGCTGVNEPSPQTTSRQLDFTLGKTWKRASDSLTFDLIYKDLVPLDGSDGDAIVPRLKYSHAFDFGEYGKVTPYAQVERWLLLPGHEHRFTATLGADYALPLGHGFTGNLGISALYDGGTPKADRGDLFSGRVGLAYALVQHVTADDVVVDDVTVELFWKSYGPHDLRDRPHQNVGGVSLTFNF